MSDEVRPTERVPGRVLVVLALGLAAVLLITVFVALVVWHTPALQPIDVPSVGKA